MLKAGHCFDCQLQALIDLCHFHAHQSSLGLTQPCLTCRGFQFTLGALAEPHIGSTLPRLQLNAGAISLSMGGRGKLVVAAQGLTAHAFKVGASHLYPLVFPANAAMYIPHSVHKGAIASVDSSQWSVQPQTPGQTILTLVQRSPAHHFKDCLQLEGLTHLAGAL